MTGRITKKEPSRCQVARQRLGLVWNATSAYEACARLTYDHRRHRASRRDFRREGR